MEWNDIYRELAPRIFMLALVFGGVLMCFFGVRLLVLTLGIAGFFIGAMVAAYIAWRTTAPPEVINGAQTYYDILSAMIHAHNRTALILWGILGGLVGLVACVLAHIVGIFILGMWLGALLVNLAIPKTAGVYLVAVSIAAAVGGVLAVIMRRMIIIITTAYNGALLMMFAIFALLRNLGGMESIEALKKMNGDTIVVLGCTALIGTVGTYVQFMLTPDKELKGGSSKGKGKKKEKGEEEE